jgi:hypothetical protein
MLGGVGLGLIKICWTMLELFEQAFILFSHYLSTYKHNMQSPLVHYAQEQAYCEAEFMSLKKQRRELEETMQEVRLR